MPEYLNATVTGRTRTTTDHLGREVIVAPMTLIVEGVLPGSRGPLFYPAEEIGRSVDGWNGMPITVNHPAPGPDTINGSARSPEVLARVGIGHVYRAAAKGNKVVAEGWFDVERTGRIEPRILEALRRNEPLELSTGLYTHNQPASPGATHNGRGYTHVARNLRPDHLAILPDSVGACGIRDGCGVLVNKIAPPPVSWAEARDRFLNLRRNTMNPLEQLIANCRCDDPTTNLLAPGAGSAALFGSPPVADPATDLTVNVGADGGLVPAPTVMVW